MVKNKTAVTIITTMNRTFFLPLSRILDVHSSVLSVDHLFVRALGKNLTQALVNIANSMYMSIARVEKNILRKYDLTLRVNVHTVNCF